MTDKEEGKNISDRAIVQEIVGNMVGFKYRTWKGI